MKRMLVDVNVLLDAVLDREPHAEAAARIWAAVESRRVAGLVPGHGVTTLFYLFARIRGADSARRAVAHLLTVFDVAAVNQATLQRALSLGWPDFEDAVCAAAAEAAGCDLIVTRDPAGFPASPVQTADPATVLALLEREGGTGRLSEAGRTGYRSRRRTAPERPRRRQLERVTPHPPEPVPPAGAGKPRLRIRAAIPGSRPRNLR